MYFVNRLPAMIGGKGDPVSDYFSKFDLKHFPSGTEDSALLIPSAAVRSGRFETVYRTQVLPSKLLFCCIRFGVCWFCLRGLRRGYPAKSLVANWSLSRLLSEPADLVTFESPYRSPFSRVVNSDAMFRRALPSEFSESFEWLLRMAAFGWSLFYSVAILGVSNSLPISMALTFGGSCICFE